MSDAGGRQPVGGPSGLGPSASPILWAVFAPFGDPGVWNRYGWGLWALGRTVVFSSFYVGWLLATLGWWRRRDLFRVHPGAWVMLLTGLVLGAFLLKVAGTMGYLADRHTILIMMIGSFWLAAGLQVLAEGLVKLLARLRPTLAGTRWTNASGWSLVCLVVLAGAALPRTLAPLHAERVGFRQAGTWLAANVAAGVYVDDPYCWSHYFAGRVFEEGRPDPPRAEPPVHYVVCELGTNKHARLNVRAVHDLESQGGTVRAQWTVKRGKEKAEIRLYEVPGQLPQSVGSTLPPFLRAQRP